jgi:hypothetical protein
MQVKTKGIHKMKKILVAAFAIALAGIVQAANYTWNSLSPMYTWDSSDATGWPMVSENTTAYFVFASAYTQSDLVNDFAAGTVDYAALSAAGNGLITADGLVDFTSASGNYTSAQQVYYVVFQDEQHMFVSGEVTAAYDALSGATVTFEYDQVEGLWTGSAIDSSTGYTGGGWYSAAAVPEPTSGLLLLLGMAGLALRRKQA